MRIRREAKQKIAELLDHWHVVEVWLKRAEQINAETIIPAINELRYASRQLYLATQLYGKRSLTALEAKHIQKRMILAEQYLLNAEHDVVDAVIGFFRKEITRIDNSVTRPAMIQFFNEYPMLCDVVLQCEELILETRQNYDKRKENYETVRSKYIDVLRKKHPELVKAEVNAKFKIADLERQIAVLKKANYLREAFNVFCGVASVVGLLYSVRIAYITGTWWPF